MTALRVAAACALFGAGLVGLLLLAAPVTAASRSVAVKYYAFSPPTITIRVGDTITWTNVDTTFVHDVTSSSFASGPLTPGKSYKHTFLKAGTFGYRCSIHLNKAKVVVTIPTTPQPTRRPTPTPPRAPPRPTPSPSATPSAAVSASPPESASTVATETSTPTTASSALAVLSTPTASAPVGQAAPVADTGSPTIVVLILILALVVASAVGLGALAARRR